MTRRYMSSFLTPGLAYRKMFWGMNIELLNPIKEGSVVPTILRCLEPNIECVQMKLESSHQALDIEFEDLFSFLIRSEDRGDTEEEQCKRLL